MKEQTVSELARESYGGREGGREAVCSEGDKAPAAAFTCLDTLGSSSIYFCSMGISVLRPAFSWRRETER